MRLLWVLGMLAIAPAACTSDITVFGGGEGDDGQGGNTTTSTSTTSVGGSSGDGGAGGVPSTTAVTATTTAVTTTATSTSATSTTSTGMTTSVPCTNRTCSTGEVCCVHFQSASNDHCASPGQCGNGYVEVGCNGPMDCAGNEVCCGHWNQQTGYQQIECMPSCNNTQNHIGLTMCGDDPNACPQFQDCEPSQFLPTGHAVCQ